MRLGSIERLKESLFCKRTWREVFIAVVIMVSEKIRIPFFSSEENPDPVVLSYGSRVAASVVAGISIIAIKILMTIRLPILFSVFLK